MILLLGAFLLPPSAAAETDPFDPTTARRLEAVLEPIRAEHRLPALAVAATRGERLLAIGVVGRRANGSPEPAELDDRFHVGSCTKSMTATLLAMLVEDGQLKFSDTLGEIFPRLAEGFDPAFRQVTVEQLLQHRAGLPDDRSPGSVFRQLRQLDGPMLGQRREMTSLVLRDPPRTPPGSQHVYSNHGYAVAGAVAEKLTGETWEALLQRRLFVPLGMTHAGFGADSDPRTVDQPCGHRRSLTGWAAVEPGPLADNPAVMGPAATVSLSIGDFARYAAFHLRGTQQDKEMLSRASFRRLHDDALGQGYSLGWNVMERPWADGKVLAHGGTNTFSIAQILLAPGRDLAFVIATNTGDGAAAQAAFQAVAKQLMDDFLAAEKLAPTDQDP